jgi:hypothetical protein
MAKSPPDERISMQEWGSTYGDPEKEEPLEVWLIGNDGRKYATVGEWKRANKAYVPDEEADEGVEE